MNPFELFGWTLCGAVFGAAIFNAFYLYRLLTKYPRIPR